MGQGVKASALYSPCSVPPAPCSHCMFLCIDIGGDCNKNFWPLAKSGCKSLRWWRLRRPDNSLARQRRRSSGKELEPEATEVAENVVARIVAAPVSLAFSRWAWLRFLATQASEISFVTNAWCIRPAFLARWKARPSLKI
jgi:hypothetical protein